MVGRLPKKSKMQNLKVNYKPLITLLNNAASLRLDIGIFNSVHGLTTLSQIATSPTIRNTVNILPSPSLKIP
jgi:hypothetical protein